MDLNENAPPPSDPRQDPDFDPIAESRMLLRRVRPATLATLTGTGGPFATLTTIATDVDGAPILLLSRLSHHTRFLEQDSRCSLLLTQGGRGDPLAHPRLTLVARAERCPEARIRERFLRRNPKAALYADFPDFSFWRAEIEAAHLNGGFARAADFEASRLLLDVADAAELMDAEEGILDHMNADHADALALYAERLAGAGPGAWRASGVDPEGLDMINGDATARVMFPQRVRSPGEARTALVALGLRAREAANRG
jgi:hypothetical protein